MPTVNGKKYPYTTAGKLAAKKAGAGKALSNAGLKRDNAGRKTKTATMADNKRSAAPTSKRSAARKAAVKGMLSPRTPSQIARIKAGGQNAKKKRKAGKGQQK